MSYTPTNWQTGDTITAEKLNNMEGGIENAINPFIVTLTPTLQDYSGTMDKTVAEINAAYEAGQEIVCRVIAGYETYIEVLCTATGHNSNYTYPSFNSYIITDDGHYIYAFTGMTDDGTKQTYSTTVYSLTPAS